MRFDLICEKFSLAEGEAPEQIHYAFDSVTGQLWLDENTYIGLDPEGRVAKLTGTLSAPVDVTFTAPWSEDKPARKARNIKRLKIQMGMSCNYSCNYCSQRFVERPEQGTPDKVDGLIEKAFAAFDFPKYGDGLRIEFWGGEPLVYWKTMKPMAEKLRTLLPKAAFSIITNGSLLTRDIVDWLDAYGFTMSISHDGPGQHVRGPCPIEDGSEETKDAIRYAIEKMHRNGRGSFGSMLNRKNTSRVAIQKWFDDRFGPGLAVGEGGLIDAYDDDGYELALTGKAEHFEFRRLAIKELTGEYRLNFASVNQRVQGFMAKIVENRELKETQGQKCGMDDPGNVAIDMSGNVITCQNVSAVQVAPNGQPHNCGSIDDLDSVAVRGATHWAARPHCHSCPVVPVCSGNCMFIQGDNWFKSCDNAYSDNIVLLSLAVLQLTGYLPVYIDAPHLPDHRKDIWGTILEHPERKPFPIEVRAA